MERPFIALASARIRANSKQFLFRPPIPRIPRIPRLNNSGFFVPSCEIPGEVGGQRSDLKTAYCLLLTAYCLLFTVHWTSRQRIQKRIASGHGSQNTQLSQHTLAIHGASRRGRGRGRGRRRVGRESSRGSIGAGWLVRASLHPCSRLQAPGSRLHLLVRASLHRILVRRKIRSLHTNLFG